MNATQISQIANYLNVSPNEIKRAEEWANVLFVVVVGLGGRFVSKKNLRAQAMKGSKAQVDWAELIKSKSVSEAIAKAEKMPGATPEKIHQFKSALQAGAEAITEANWWIDNQAKSWGKNYEPINEHFVHFESLRLNENFRTAYTATAQG